jgi:putative transposase
VQLTACSNALAETINGLYKAELIHRRAPWKTREAVELATLEWVSWFNHHRLLEPIGYIPPAEAEANYWRQQRQAIAATGLRTAAAVQGVEP